MFQKPRSLLELVLPQGILLEVVDLSEKTLSSRFFIRPYTYFANHEDVPSES